jgi:integrase
MRPEDIDTTVIDNLRLLLTQSGKKPGTIRNVLELLRRIISFGVKKGLITSAQVTAQFEMPLLNNEKTEDLTPRQLQALLAAITETKYKKAGDMMLLALYTGMRRGEMFNLQWEHIDWNRGFINLVGQDDGFGAKSGQSERIPLNDLARQLLSAIPHGKSPFVFPGKFGGRLVDIRKQADALKKEAGLPEDFRPFHGLRHVYASMVASTGKVSMYELQKLLTHKSSAMTQRYAHLRDDALKRASQAAGEALAQALDGSQDRCSR